MPETPLHTDNRFRSRTAADMSEVRGFTYNEWINYIVTENNKQYGINRANTTSEHQRCSSRSNEPNGYHLSNEIKRLVKRKIEISI